VFTAVLGEAMSRELPAMIGAERSNLPSCLSLCNSMFFTKKE
jgi:hypothetical protein